MMNTRRRRHARNEHFDGPHRLCRDLDLGPDPRGQIAALEAAGCTLIRTGTGSGTSLGNRPELGIILDFFHSGETLAVTRIDRLARSVKDLQVIVPKLRERGANIAATERPWMPRPLPARPSLTCLGSLPMFESSLRRQQQARESARPGGGVPVADGLRRSTWTQSGPELPKGGRRPGSRARWGSRAAPSARPRLECPARLFKVPWKSGKTPSRRRHEHRDPFAVCSSRCPSMQLRSV